jgi:hypothetical protein
MAPLRPTTVAVHDHRYVLWKSRKVEFFVDVGFFCRQRTKRMRSG